MIMQYLNKSFNLGVRVERRGVLLSTPGTKKELVLTSSDARQFAIGLLNAAEYLDHITIDIVEQKERR